MTAEHAARPPKARKPGARPCWRHLSAAELAREQAQVQRKARELRERLSREQRRLDRRPAPCAAAAPLQELRERIQDLQATAQTLRQRAQQR